MLLFELEYPAKTTLKMDPVLRRRHDIKTLNFLNPQAPQAWCGRFSGFWSLEIRHLKIQTSPRRKEITFKLLLQRMSKSRYMRFFYNHGRFCLFIPHMLLIQSTPRFSLKEVPFWALKLSSDRLKPASKLLICAGKASRARTRAARVCVTFHDVPQIESLNVGKIDYDQFLIFLRDSRANEICKLE